MKLRVGAKIAAGFAVILVILFAMGGYSYYKAGETGDHLENIERASLRGGFAAHAQQSFLGAVLGARGYMAYGNEDFAKQTDEKFT